MSHDGLDESKALDTCASIENQTDANVSCDHNENDDVLSTDRVEVSIVVQEVSNGHAENDDMLSTNRVEVSIVVHEVIDEQDKNEAKLVSKENECFSRNSSFHDQCRICHLENEEYLVDLGCQCRGGLEKVHRSCIDAWFQKRGSNKCEICQVVAANVPPPKSCTSLEKLHFGHNTIRRPVVAREQRRCCSFLPSTIISILIVALMLDAFISMGLHVAEKLPYITICNVIILILGIAAQHALELSRDCYLRRAVERAELGGNPEDLPAP